MTLLIASQMKKIIFLFTVGILSSCSTTTLKTVSSNKLYEILNQQSYGGATIQFYEILSESNEIKMLLNDENLKRKITPIDVHQANFIILNMGEKPTGGYSIGIDNVEETVDTIVIKVKIINPEAGSIVTQSLTTPFCVVKINSKKKIIFI